MRVRNSTTMGVSPPSALELAQDTPPRVSTTSICRATRTEPSLETCFRPRASFVSSSSGVSSAIVTTGPGRPAGATTALPALASRASRRFIQREPMNPATNRLWGPSFADPRCVAVAGADMAGARSHLLQAGDHLQERGCPASRRPDEDAGPALLHGQVDAVENLELAESPGDGLRRYFPHAFVDGAGPSRANMRLSATRSAPVTITGRPASPPAI